MTILAILGLSCWLWLWFMIKRSEQWGMLVDKENAFWVKSGIASASLTEKIKRFEKGLGQKILVGAAALIGTIGFIAIGYFEYVRR